MSRSGLGGLELTVKGPQEDVSYLEIEAECVENAEVKKFQKEQRLKKRLYKARQAKWAKQKKNTAWYKFKKKLQKKLNKILMDLKVDYKIDWVEDTTLFLSPEEEMMAAQAEHSEL